MNESTQYFLQLISNSNLKITFGEEGNIRTIETSGRSSETLSLLTNRHESHLKESQELQQTSPRTGAYAPTNPEQQEVEAKQEQTMEEISRKVEQAESMTNLVLLDLKKSQGNLQLAQERNENLQDEVDIMKHEIEERNDTIEDQAAHHKAETSQLRTNILHLTVENKDLKVENKDLKSWCDSWRSTQNMVTQTGASSINDAKQPDNLTMPRNNKSYKETSTQTDDISSPAHQLETDSTSDSGDLDQNRTDNHDSSFSQEYRVDEHLDDEWKDAVFTSGQILHEQLAATQKEKKALKILKSEDPLIDDCCGSHESEEQPESDSSEIARQCNLAKFELSKEDHTKAAISKMLDSHPTVAQKQKAALERLKLERNEKEHCFDEKDDGLLTESNIENSQHEERPKPDFPENFETVIVNDGMPTESNIESFRLENLAKSVKEIACISKQAWWLKNKCEFCEIPSDILESFHSSFNPRFKLFKVDKFTATYICRSCYHSLEKKFSSLQSQVSSVEGKLPYQQ